MNDLIWEKFNAINCKRLKIIQIKLSYYYYFVKNIYKTSFSVASLEKSTFYHILVFISPFHYHKNNIKIVGSGFDHFIWKLIGVQWGKAKPFKAFNIAPCRLILRTIIWVTHSRAWERYCCISTKITTVLWFAFKL